jgi:hypothetical protein
MLYDATNTGRIEATDQVRVAFHAFGAPPKAPFTPSGSRDNAMPHRAGNLKRAALAASLVAGASASHAQDNKVSLFKVVTVKDEIVIGLSDDEMKALGGSDASAVAHTLAQKGDMTVWQYNVHRGPNGELQQAPTAKIGLLANASLRVEPYSTPYTIVPHQ